MTLTGLPFLLLLLLGAALLLAGTYVMWSRWPAAFALPVRLLCLLLLMGWGALVVLDQINRTYDFYSSLADLLGSTPSAHALAVLSGPRPEAGVRIETKDWATVGLSDARRGRGELLSVSYRGTRSSIIRSGLLYLPAAYFLGPPDRRFAAIEFFHGFPGVPQDFQRALDISGRLDSEISAGRMPPVIGVFPRTYEGPVSECVNAVGGEQDATYLTVDVQDDLVNSFRVLPGRSWAALGYSTGGYCAVNLGLQNPERFSAVVSLSGFFTAGEDPGAAALFRASHTARHENSPIWWVQHRAPTAPAMYLFASGGDPAAVREVGALQAVHAKYARAQPLVVSLALGGGHNWGVWGGAIDPALDWLGQYLPAPLAPPLTETDTGSEVRFDG
jgi:enterochelin esterase-like enzyme